MTQAKHNRRIVIIGAVAAGTSAAAKARRNDENAEIVLFDRDEHISYSGCGLPYFIGGAVSDFQSLVPRDAHFFKSKYNVDVYTRHEVLSVDPEAHSLRVKNLVDMTERDERYDTLVLATGATPLMPDLPGIGMRHVFPLRNPSHALAIRGFIDTGKPHDAVVVGSGFIGMEMVDALTQTGLAVSLVEKLPAICPFVDPDMAPHIEKELERRSVRIFSGRTVRAIHETEVLLDDGTAVPCDLVLMAVGIRPETRLAREMGIALGTTGAIVVDTAMRTSLPDVYACGDCIENISIIDGRALYRPLGSTANKTGRIAGDALTGGSLTHRGIAGTGIFNVFDLTVAATGLTEAQARMTDRDIVVSHNIKPDRPTYFHGRDMVIKAIADASDGTLLGVQIIGYDGVDKRIDVFVTAMTAGLRAEDLFHLDLAYAPPYATTKDPVHYTGMILDNVVHRNRALLTADQLNALPPGSYEIVDTRVPGQYDEGHVPGAVNLPQDGIREAIGKTDLLDREKTIVTYCNKGITGNAVQNLLINRGFKKVYTLSGGFRQFEACRRQRKERDAT